MQTSTASNYGIVGKMRDSGIAIDVAVKFHTFMRQTTDSHKSRKAVRVMLQNIRKNYNATH